MPHALVCAGQSVATYPSAGNAVYVPNFKKSFPSVTEADHLVSSWACTPEVAVTCENIESSCNMAVSVGMVSLPRSVENEQPPMPEQRVPSADSAAPIVPDQEASKELETE
jgi:hypothetical protein